MKFCTAIFLMITFTVLTYAQDTIDSKNCISVLLRTSKILYPCSKGWIPITAMKKADMTKLRPALLQIVKKNKNRDEHGYASEVLEGGTDNFYEFDMDHDGLTDIIYTRPHEDPKKMCTVIWHGQEGGGYSEDYNIESSLLLSISDSIVHKAVSVYCGTWDNSADDFILCNIVRTRDDIYLLQDSSCAILRSTVVPDNFVETKRFISVAKEMIFRDSPEIIDTYNEQASKLNKMAVWGNIKSKYLRGVTGAILGSKTDGIGALWYFVYVSRLEYILCTYALNEINAGWVLAKDVNILH